MAVRILSAPVGKGKTLNLSRIAIKLYKEENTIFKRHRKSYIHYNSIYSNYPILLWYQKRPFKYMLPNGEIFNSVPIKKIVNKETKLEYYSVCKVGEQEYFGVYSIKINFIDMRIAWNFGENASFFIDEIQYIYDSQEYKDFPDCIAHFFQVHRHLGYNMIYTNSQSLSRVIKRVLCVSEEFWNVLDFKPKLFLLPFLSKVKFKITYDIEGSKASENEKEEKKYIDYSTVIFFNKRVFNSYITKYLGALNKDLDFYKMSTYTDLLMTKKDILRSFNVTKEQKEDLINMEF